MKKLENLKWKPMWASHLGCIKGCLDYLGVDVSDAWLFGATGHAFLINIHDVVCPSGPTAWRSEEIYKLGKNLGFKVDYIEGFKNQPDFSKKQETAWEMTRKAIDEGKPCFGWELDIPEYYVVNGYDSTSYLHSGPCSEEMKPKPYNELSNSEIGVLIMCVLNKCPGQDDITTVKDAFNFTLEFARNPQKWLPKYKGGLEGYDLWINALKNGTAHGFGVAYNAAVWRECRHYAVEFFDEAKKRLPDTVTGLLDAAKSRYQTAADNLKQVSELFPFPPKGEEVKNSELCGKAVFYLEKAQEAEEQGLKTIEEIMTLL